MTDKRLKSIADRINKLMDEREGIAADIRDIYAEAKGIGYIPKALRKVIARLRMDPDKLAEDDTLVELYEAALGPVGKAMEAVREGATLDAAAEANGVHRATVARARAVAKSSENATAAKQTGIATQTHGADGVIIEIPPEQGRPEQQSPLGQAAPTLADEAPATPSVGAVASESERVASSYTDDDLTVPDFLRGASPANRSLRGSVS